MSNTLNGHPDMARRFKTIDNFSKKIYSLNPF